MTALSSLLLVLLFICGIFIFLRGQETNRRNTPNNGLTAEYRTDLAIDECMDALRMHSEEDTFEYTCIRQTAGSFDLHFTLHRATRQPVDTLYSMQLDAGRQTIITLTFLREAFGYKEPVFPVALLDDFFAKKLAAKRTL